MLLVTPPVVASVTSAITAAVVSVGVSVMEIAGCSEALPARSNRKPAATSIASETSPPLVVPPNAALLCSATTVAAVNLTVKVVAFVKTADEILVLLRVKSWPPPEPVPLMSHVTLDQSKTDLTSEPTAATVPRLAPVNTIVPRPSSPIVKRAAVACVRVAVGAVVSMTIEPNSNNDVEDNISIPLKSTTDPAA